MMSIECSMPSLKPGTRSMTMSVPARPSDTFHHELVRTAEALGDDGPIDWEDWLAFKALADELLGRTASVGAGP
jgi:hypothetical protein